MAFLFKVFSGSERLKEKQKSADIVNEKFQAELNDVQTKLEVENYELQMLVEMIYDSSYPESQKFLKQPTKDRLYAHKETISSLLFGLAAQGVSVAPLILTHFQKYGCDAIAETLINLLELVRPLLASKDIPEFTSDDILDAIDVQWHSSVRSSPGFGSLRGSRAPSPLQSPRVSFSNLSPRQSISSPQSPFYIDRILGSSPGQIPFALTSPRKTQSFSFSPPSSLLNTGREGARADPPRRSLSSHYPVSDVGLSQSYGGRLQPLTEHDEETNTGFRKSRMQDDDRVEPSPKDEADSRENSSLYGADEDNALSRNRPQSSSSSTGVDGNDGSNHDFEKNSTDFSTVDHNTLTPVLPYNLSSNVNTGEYSKALSINIPRSSIPFEVEDLSGDESAGRTQVADGHGQRNDDAGDEKSNETFEGFLPLGRIRGRSNSFGKSRLDFSHEQFDKSVRDVNAETFPSKESSVRVGGNEDTAMNVLESDVPFRDSFSSSHCESQIPQQDIAASSTSLSIKNNHVDDSEQRVLEMNGDELNSTDDSLTFNGVKEDYVHFSEDRVRVDKMVGVPTPQLTIKKQLQTARDNCEEVQEAKDSLLPDSMFEDSSMPTLDHENVMATQTHSPHVKEVEDESLDVPEVNSLVENCEHDVQKETALARDSHNGCEIIEESLSSPFQGDAKRLGDDIQNEMNKAEEDMGKLHTNNKSRYGAVNGVEEDGVVEVVKADVAVDGAEVDGAKDSVRGNGAADGVQDYRAADNVRGDGSADDVQEDGTIDGVEGDVDKLGNSFSTLIPASSVEDDNSLVSAFAKDKEESYSSRVEPNEEHLVEKPGVQAEGEIEVQEQEPPHPRGIVGTDVFSQSSFSDDYGNGGGTFSSDDEGSSLPSVRAKGTEETTPFRSVTVIDEDWDLCHVDNGEHISGSGTSGLLSSVTRDESKAHEAAEGTGLDEHVSNSKVDLEQDAELHTPSYDSVTFDLIKLSRDNNEDISSYSSLQSEDGAVPDVMSESTSCDDLDTTLANCFTGKEPASPSNSTVSRSTVVKGASLLSLSPQYENGLADDINSEVVLSSKIDGSQNLCSSVNIDAGLSTDHSLDSMVAEQKDEDAAGASMIHSVTLSSANIDEEEDWERQSEKETNELKNPSHGDSELHLSSVEGETAPPLQNALEVVQNESVILSHVEVEESNDSELFVEESSSGQRKESSLVGAMDFPLAQNYKEVFFNSEALSNDFGDSFAIKRVLRHNEVNTSGDNHSQHARDEEEQAVTIDSAKKTDTEGFKSEDYLRQADAEQNEVPTFASLKAEASGEFSAPEHLSVRGEQFEVNGSIHQRIEKESGAIARSANYSFEDPDDFEVSRSTDEEAASPSGQDDIEVLSDQYGLDSADSKAKGDETGATDQLISSKSEDEPARINENDLEEHSIPGTGSQNLSSTIDEENRNSLTDRVDECHDTRCKGPANRIPSHFVQYVEKSEVDDYKMVEPKHDTEANPLPAPREVSVFRADSSELASFESQSKEKSGQEDVLQFPEYDRILLAEDKRAGVTGATCDAITIYSVEHGHDEGKSDKQKDLVAYVDEATLPSQAEELGGQDFKQALDGVKFSTIKESPEIVETCFLADSATLETEEGFPNKGTLLEESGVALSREEQVGEGSEPSNGTETAQHSDASINDQVDEWEIVRKHEMQEGSEVEKGSELEKGSDTILNTEEPASEGIKEPTLHTLERGTERDEKDDQMEFAATYGVFLHNTKFLDSEGNFVRALTSPATTARSTELLQSGPERHSIHDSIICIPPSADRSSRRHKNLKQRRRCNFLGTLCCSCSCFSRPSTL